MFKSRREFIKQIFSIAASSLTITSGLIKSSLAYAQWPKENYSPRTYQQTLRFLFKDAEFIPSKKIKLGRLPHVAENGAVVPISVTCSHENVNKIYILVENNPFPLSAEFFLSPAVKPRVAARLKMAKSSKVIVIVEAEDKLYHISKWVKVIEGGCG